VRGAFASLTPPRGAWRAWASDRRLRFAVPSATALALAALTAGVAPESGSRSAHAQPAASTPTPTSTAPGPSLPHKRAVAPVRALYRIVGCRSHGPHAYQHGARVHEVAIGFDDGPVSLTPAFVRMLEREHARATFFMIGSQVSAGYRSMLLRELRDGDALGDHSFTHPDLVRSRGTRWQLSATISAIRANSGYTPCVFRPPYGAYDQSVVRAAQSLGLATVLWDVDPVDWARPGTPAIVRRVLGQVRPGSIILSHDGGGPRAETLAAYPAIIHALHARGYRLVTIPELLGFRPLYRPCVRLCSGIGLTRAQLPRDAIIERAR
jgi:peptidoglycan/xylan/chitin deacetylase (PgdA/CDA1 family)